MRTPRTQSDPIKATPREAIEEVTKVCEVKPVPVALEVEKVIERLQPTVNVSISTETSTESVSESLPEERTIEEPLRLVQRTEVTLRVNAPMTDTACQTDQMSTPLPTLPTPPASPTPSTRHHHHDEAEYDQLSRDLASHLSPSHHLQAILGEYSLLFSKTVQLHTEPYLRTGGCLEGQI